MGFSYRASGYVKNVTISEAIELMKNDPNIIILDVRTHQEYKSAHIKGAINIPYDQIKKRMNEITKYRDNSIIVYCKSGSRSTAAVVILSSYGFNKIYHMYQGMTAWPHH